MCLDAIKSEYVLFALSLLDLGIGLMGEVSSEG